MLCVSFSLPLLSSAWMSLSCLPTCLLDNLTIIPFLMVVKRFKPFLESFFKNCIIFQYSYQSSVSISFSVLCYITVDICCVTTWHLTPACYHLTPACYHLIPAWYYLSPATCYITIWLVIIIFQESCSAILYYIQWPTSLVLMYSCYSFNSWTCHVHAIPVNW